MWYLRAILAISFSLIKVHVINSLFPLFNSSLNDKILGWSKVKAFADNKINSNEKLKLVLGRIENIFGKGDIAGYQHFHLFPKCFQKPPFSGSLKVGIV